MQRTVALAHVPDYEPRETARSRLSKLAVTALSLSLLTSPLVLRFLPDGFVIVLLRTARLGLIPLALPAMISLVVSLAALRRLRHNRSLFGMPLVAVALVLSSLTILFYVSCMFIRFGPGD